MEKLYTSKTCLKMAGRMHTPHSTPLDPPLAKATETIKRVWHISVTWHHWFCYFILKSRVKRGGCIAQLHPLNTLVASVVLHSILTILNPGPLCVFGPPGDDPFCPPSRRAWAWPPCLPGYAHAYVQSIYHVKCLKQWSAIFSAQRTGLKLNFFGGPALEKSQMF